jgi:hypothetical protein
MTDAEHTPLPRLILPGENQVLTDVLLEGLHILLKYPLAARALIQAFIEEGKTYAETPEGKEMKGKLAESELVSRGRFIWDAYGLDALTAEDFKILPSAWLDIFLAAVSHPDLETILSSLIVEELKRENVHFT